MRQVLNWAQLGLSEAAIDNIGKFIQALTFQIPQICVSDRTKCPVWNRQLQRASKKNAIDDIEKLIQSFNFSKVFLSSCKPFQTSCLTVSSGIYWGSVINCCKRLEKASRTTWKENLLKIERELKVSAVPKKRKNHLHFPISLCV